jgi:hypothetical protein
MASGVGDVYRHTRQVSLSESFIVNWFWADVTFFRIVASSQQCNYGPWPMIVHEYYNRMT